MRATGLRRKRRGNPTSTNPGQYWPGFGKPLGLG